MELQYLIESEERAEQCLALAGDKEVAHDKYKIDNDYFIVTLNLKTNDRKAAFRLSDLNDAVVEKNNPTVLVNGSAAYFNKILFPLINDFERKLRKLLYVASVINPTDEKMISDLEMNICQLFEKDIRK